MIRVRQIKIEVSRDNKENLLKAVSKKIGVEKDKITKLSIYKQSLDARCKSEIYYVYEVDVSLENEEYILRKNQSTDIFLSPDLTYNFEKCGKEELNHPPIIVGSGPAGLFAAYILAENNYKPIIIERGEEIEKRIETVNEFWKDGILNPNSNVQFGEGGAGTFSDGKLNTLVKDDKNRIRKVYETFVEFGANEDILYSYKPHIGTDVLVKVIKNMREKIKELGGTFKYNTCLTGLETENDKLKAIIVNNSERIETDVLILAIGHSARDTFKMLYENNINMSPKPFAVGLRVEHSQQMINESQYGEKYKNILPPATYSLTYKTKSGRGVYSFCMCPGGYVVNASSEEGYLAINGMSYRSRNSENANSAIVVSISPDDFGHHPLDGIEFQRKLEKKAYQLGNGKIPIQLLKDFIENKKTQELKTIKPIFKGNYTLSNINDILPKIVSDSIKEAFPNFGTKIKGFDNDDTIIAAIESRTSSPICIKRDEYLESNIKGIYPTGEGAGYAGGITSASIDGIKVAEEIGKKYK